MTPQQNNDEQNDYDKPPPPSSQQQQQSEPAYRSSSPPIPALKNKGKKPKAKVNPVRNQSFDDTAQQQSPPPLPPFQTNDDFVQMPPADDTVSQGPQTYRKPPTPRQPGLFPILFKLSFAICSCLHLCL